MDDIPISVLIGALLFLIIISGFFSGSETGLMSLNRYRLRHMADKKHKNAQRALRLLSQPEKLIGLILLGNNFVNILAASIATIIGIRLWGEEVGMVVSTLGLTVIVLIFAEVTPKTIAALKPESVALPAAIILEPLLKIAYPIVWLINLCTKGVFILLGVKTDKAASTSLNQEELRVVVNEAGSMIPHKHQKMLLSILDLEKATVEDIMVPRNEIVGIDINDEWGDITKQLTQSQHTRLPVFEDDINHVIGMVHVRDTIKLFLLDKFGKDDFRAVLRDTYFIPEGIPLNTQLINFQKEIRRFGMVVNEYGDVQGLVTLEDILEEIVGEFTTDPAALSRDVHLQDNGTYLVDGSITVRDLNKMFQWDLTTDGPKTLNGLIIEYLEHIPEPGTSLLLANYPIEIVQTSKKIVKTVLIDPQLVKRRMVHKVA